MLYFSLSKNCTYKDASARTLWLPTEALPRPYRLGHITECIRLRFAPPKFAPLTLRKLQIHSERYTIWKELYHIDSVFPLLRCFYHIF